MAIFSISIDTETRNCTLTVGGVQIPFEDFYASKYKDHSNPDKYYVELSYTQSVKNDSGMTEQRRFYLPQPEEKMDHVVNGLASEKVIDQKTLTEDLIRLLSKS